MPGALSHGGLASYGLRMAEATAPTTIGELAASCEINFD